MKNRFENHARDLVIIAWCSLYIAVNVMKFAPENTFLQFIHTYFLSCNMKLTTKTAHPISQRTKKLTKCWCVFTQHTDGDQLVSSRSH